MNTPKTERKRPVRTRPTNAEYTAKMQEAHTALANAYSRIIAWRKAAYLIGPCAFVTGAVVGHFL